MRLIRHLLIQPLPGEGIGHLRAPANSASAKPPNDAQATELTCSGETMVAHSMAVPFTDATERMHRRHSATTALLGDRLGCDTRPDPKTSGAISPG